MKNNQNSEFITKFMEAKRLEKEAFMSLLPEETIKHVEVIKKEMKAILVECLLDSSSTINQKSNNPKVKKVEIG